MKSRKTILFFLAFLLILSLGCGLLGSDEEEPAVVEEAAPTAEVAEAEVPAATLEEPSPAPTHGTADVDPPDRACRQRLSRPRCRPGVCPPLNGSMLVVQDTDKNPALGRNCCDRMQLRWPSRRHIIMSFICCHPGSNFPRWKRITNQEMAARKYTPARNEQGANQMYLLTYLYSLNKTSKNAVLFYAELSNREPMVLVIYSNPIE